MWRNSGQMQCVVPHLRCIVLRLQCLRNLSRLVHPQRITVSAGAVDRSKLGQFVLGEGNEAYLAQLEAAIHPLVEAQRDTFLQEVRSVLCRAAHCLRLCITRCSWSLPYYWWTLRTECMFLAAHTLLLHDVHL